MSESNMPCRVHRWRFWTSAQQRCWDCPSVRTAPRFWTNGKWRIVW